VKDNISTVKLIEARTGALVPASLFDTIQPHHLDDHRVHWKPLVRKWGEQHGHWDWHGKCVRFTPALGYQSFAIECQGCAQGLMLVQNSKSCRHVSQLGLELVYVAYLEVAPWNRKPSISRPDPSKTRFEGVGKVLIAAAIQQSRELGYEGRIGLHSLPQAESYYRNQVVMLDLGVDRADPQNHGLRYFEMSSAQASAFMVRRKRRP